jgi:hypothetical protein
MTDNTQWADVEDGIMQHLSGLLDVDVIDDRIIPAMRGFYTELSSAFRIVLELNIEISEGTSVEAIKAELEDKLSISIGKVKNRLFMERLDREIDVLIEHGIVPPI